MMHVIQCFIFSIATYVCQSSNFRGENHGVIEEYDSSNLRYVAFGTSITYGTGVGREEDRYTNLLSSNGTNLGMRGSDPSSPTVCTQSLVGDAIYDVIIVEYHMAYNMGLNPLVKRLRERFVDATIIAVNLWMYKDVYVLDDKGEKLSFVTWLKENGFNRNTPEARDFVKESNVRFAFETERLAERDTYMDKMAKDYNVKLYSWAKVNHNAPNVKALLLRFMPYYAWDFIHWSESGHRLAVQTFRRIVEEEKTKVSNRVGSWGAGDKCVNWQNTGKLVGNMPTSGKMEEFDKSKGKFALEFAFGGGYVSIENPFPYPCELALTYMATAPAPSIYPKTKISIKSSDQESIIVDPTDTKYEFPVHVQHTTVIGKVNPGMNIVLITPLERKEKPFRLVGYAMAPKIKVPKVWSNRLHVETPFEM